MEKTLGGFRRGNDIVVIAVFGVLLCIARTSVADFCGEQFLSSEPEEVPSSDENICHTNGCHDIAETYLKNMDQSIDPCDNFYKFACGGFVDSTIIPGDQPYMDQINLIDEQLNKQLRTIIEFPIQPNEPKPFRLVKNFYNACMNEDANEAQSLKSLREILNKLGGWPVLSGDRWSDRNFDWKSSIYKVRDAGYKVEYLMNILTFDDLMNSTKRSIYIDHPTFGLPEEYLVNGFDDKYVQEYHNYMIDIAVILGANKDKARTELKESLLFELKLVNISMREARRRKDISLYYNPMTLTELKNNYSSIPWTDYFAKLLSSGDTIAEDEVVVVSDQNYISNFMQLIEVTPKRTLANYVMWRIVANSVPYMNRDIRARQLAYRTMFIGVTERKPRWKECIDVVSASLSLGIGALYVKNYFSEEAKTNAVKIIMNIKKQLAKTLRQAEWMDETTRERALEKLTAMSSVVGYSDEILNVDKLEKYYENLKLSGENYLESFVNCSLFESNKAFGRLHEPVKKNDWTSETPAVVNAFYSRFDNSIKIPAGILQGIFFSNDRPKYTNYGGIGFIIGHEITHGFDQVGSRFDKDGNLANWWATTTKENFVKRAQCVINQYGNYTVEEVELKLNGELTVNENIADNGGMKEAYLAYANWVLENQPEKQLPGLNYTSNQMFWISVANGWCTKYTKELLRLMVATDTHSPAEWRISGSLSNTPQFSKDFNCPIGSKMNPIDKCFVW